MLSIAITNNQSSFGPGETVSGTAQWEMREAPEHVRLFLIWYTDGKGDEDTAIVDQAELGVGESRGQERFSFALPEGPYSFEGKLIALQWALELVTEEPFSVERTPIMVSPWVKRVVLNNGDDSDDEFSSDDD